MVPLHTALMKHEANLQPQLQSNKKTTEKWILLQSTLALAAPFAVNVMVRIKSKGKKIKSEMGQNYKQLQ